VSEDSGSAFDFAGGKGNSGCVFESFYERLRGGGNGQVRGDGLRGTGKLIDETRLGGLEAFALACVAEVDLRCGAKQAEGDGAGKFPVELRGGVRHGGFALDVERQEWMGCACGRPFGFAGAEEPDGVGDEAGGFGGPGDLDGCFAGLGGEEGFVESASEGGEKLRPADAAAIVAERCAGLDGLLPTLERLELHAGKGTRAGPARGFEELGN